MDLNQYAAEVHKANEKWWVDIETGERLNRNKGELLCLVHSEISECLEGVRKGLADDHLPHRSMEEVELASEFRPLRRDSLRPAGAALVSTMPAPSGDTGRGYWRRDFREAL